MTAAAAVDSPLRLSAWMAATWLMTLFLAVLVPTYLWRYGPTNFLYFCDTALLLALFSLWSRQPLAASMALVGILLPQMLWSLDLVLRIGGISLIGMTNYMFNADIPWPIRALSLFHLWLPLLLWWMVRRLGYDRRAFLIWCSLGSIVLAICWFLLPAPPAPANAPGLPVNVNLVFGFNDDAPQHWMPPWLWFTAMLIGLPLLVWWPTHLLLRRVMPAASNRLPSTPTTASC